jgi:hypothetical protein
VVGDACVLVRFQPPPAWGEDWDEHLFDHDYTCLQRAGGGGPVKGVIELVTDDADAVPGMVRLLRDKGCTGIDVARADE